MCPSRIGIRFHNNLDRPFFFCPGKYALIVTNKRLITEFETGISQELQPVYTLLALCKIHLKCVQRDLRIEIRFHNNLDRRFFFCPLKLWKLTRDGSDHFSLHITCVADSFKMFQIMITIGVVNNR